MLRTLLTALLLSSAVVARPVVVPIDPSSTSTAISRARGPHLAVSEPGVASNGLLLISLGGTSSRPADLLAFDKEAAALGYHVLAIDYPNSVISTAPRDNPSPAAYDWFRREIVTGDPVSDLVAVDPANSLNSRITLLVDLLARRNPAGWGAFRNAAGVDWSRVVVAGHSQGSGHAAYLGKLHPLRGVIMLAGPQDTHPAGPVPWLSQPGATPGERYVALLHQNDTFGCARQLAAVQMLRGRADAPELFQAVPDHQAPILICTDRVGDPHMSVINRKYQYAWDLLLKRFSGL